MARALFYAMSIFLCLTAAVQAATWDFSIYAGRMTSEPWENTISTSVDYLDTGLLAVAGTRTIKHFLDGDLSLEIEAQIGKYFGDQDNWEFNLPIMALRWRRFPWQRYLDTTLAWGIGPSYASKIPEVEATINEASEQWLVYWFAELTFGPPQSNWALLLRLHHRSGAYGLVAEDGGSNTLAAGVKYSF